MYIPISNNLFLNRKKSIMNPSTVQGGVRKKLLRTCDACRTSKIRCIVDEKSDDVCER